MQEWIIRNAGKINRECKNKYTNKYLKNAVNNYWECRYRNFGGKTMNVSNTEINNGESSY